MKKYIMPIQDMLKNYKKSLNKIKEQNNYIESNLKDNK
jgi:hypothetical protein